VGFLVAPGEFRLFCLPLQHDQLLAQKGGLEYQFWPAARQVKGCTFYSVQDSIWYGRVIVGPGPSAVAM
jgi:hypothetical protein